MGVENDSTLTSLVTSAFNKIEKHAGEHATHYVALSGGVDSIHLLHTLNSVARSFGRQIKAIHINHQLSSKADTWQSLCEQTCEKLNLVCMSRQVSVDHKQSGGVETNARTARWEVFDQLLSPDDCLWLAHHLDDQVETLLLNLLRGSGVAGAQGIHSMRRRKHYRVCRPWLSISKQQLVQSAQHASMEWLEDESNTDLTIRRNLLRHTILPSIESAFPDYRKTLAAFSERMQDTQQLLDQLAENDADFALSNQQLPLAKIRQLSILRGANLIRSWLLVNGIQPPNADRLNELLRQLQNANANTCVECRWSHFVIRQQCDQLLLEQTAQESVNTQLSQADSWVWKNLELPLELDSLKAELTAQASNQGIRPPFENEIIRIRLRQGGEFCRPDYRRHRTQLKTIYQELNIPKALRPSIPLLFYNDQLVAAIGAFYVAEFVTDKRPAIQFNLTDLCSGQAIHFHDHWNNGVSG